MQAIVSWLTLAVVDCCEVMQKPENSGSFR